MSGKFSRPLDLFDEKSFRLLLDYEVRRSQRYINPVSLIQLAPAMRTLVPIETESVLNSIAFLLATRLRVTDTPARLGENKFAVLLSNTNEAGARTVCERLISIVTEMHSAPESPSIRIFICIGVTSHPGGVTLNAESLMHQAEIALTRSQVHGPQTYVLFSDSPTRPRPNPF